MRAGSRQREDARDVWIRRDRLVVLTGLVAITLASWGYLVHLAIQMDAAGMPIEVAMPRAESWTFVELLLLWVMWTVMMVAMMVPTATVMVLTYATLNRRRRARGRPYVPTAIFLAGYLVVWAGFSILATLAQWGLHEAALLSPMMVSTSATLGGVLLVASGSFQWTPLKHACLSHCRSPMAFLMTEWRDGRLGAFRMGLRHGLFCTGCCWILMALLFIAGVMNLLWVGTIMAFVLIEKLSPQGERIARLSGSALVIAGLVLLVRP